MNRKEFDNFLKNEGGYQEIIGTDEVGRGAIAGPVVSCAVVIIKYFDYLENIKDSKKLTPKKRKEIYEVLINSPNIRYSIKSKDNLIIDKTDILTQSLEAMKEASYEIYDETKETLVLVDGSVLIRNFKLNQNTVIKGDDKSLAIAAASIIAKVFRDEYMKNLMKDDIYCFSKHKGYGTKLHYEMLKKYGISKYHRQSFLKSFYDKKNNKATLF